MGQRIVNLPNAEVEARRKEEEGDGATVTVIPKGDGTSDLIIKYPDPEL